MRAAIYLQLRQILGTRKVWLMVVLLLLPVGLTLTVKAAGGFAELQQADDDLNFYYGPDSVEVIGMYLFFLYPYILSVLQALLYGTSVINSEMEGKTITYLFTRPISKWRILIGKYLGIIFCLTIGLSLSLIASWLILGGPGGWRMLTGLLLAGAFGTAAYCSVFLVIGVIISKRAMSIGLLYAIIIEGFLSFIPAVINKGTIAYYLRSLALEVSQTEERFLPHKFELFSGLVGAPAATLALIGITVFMLVLASGILSIKECSVIEQV